MAQLTRVTKFFSADEGLKQRKWYIVDATDKPLGRLASKVAIVLLGKHKATFTPNADMGDHVIVINADKVALSGKKLETKIKFSHSGYPGGARYDKVKHLMDEKPERVIQLAIKGMVPKTHLGRKMLLKLNVYKGEKHPHSAQKPEPMPATLLKSSKEGK